MSLVRDPGQLSVQVPQVGEQLGGKVAAGPPHGLCRLSLLDDPGSLGGGDLGGHAAGYQVADAACSGELQDGKAVLALPEHSYRFSWAAAT